MCYIMITFNEIETIVSDYFANLTNVYGVYLHGSFAKNTTHLNSDIDIGIMSDFIKFNKIELLRMASDLEIKLGRVVDLGIISSENLVYSKEAIHNGKCIHCTDNNKRMLMEATLLAMYVELQEERKEILNAYRN